MQAHKSDIPTHTASYCDFLLLDPEKLYELFEEMLLPALPRRVPVRGLCVMAACNMQ